MLPSIDPHDLIPPPIHDRVDPYVQRWVAGTNGRLYIPLINKLPRYPIPRWPGDPPASAPSLLLDIGCGWGRWLVSAARAGYTPIGIDIKLEALKAARRVLRANGLAGYVVLADLMHLPFECATFDYVYSYSVIQHTHRRRADSCLRECARVLRPGAISFLEFPVKHGLTNFRRMFQTREEDNFDSWCVRYYSLAELRRWLTASVGETSVVVDCFCGIGVRPEDLDLMPWKYKPLIIASVTLSRVAAVFPPLRYLSDSVFLRSRKPGAAGAASRESLAAPLEDNLAILPALRCPVTSQPLQLDAAGRRLITADHKRAYPVDDGIPILTPEAGEAVQ